MMILAGACALQRKRSRPTEEAYDFKPTPEQRSFGGLVAHVADSQARTCSTVIGEPKSVGAGSKTTKADLVAALKQSFEICDAAYNSLTDATAVEMITTPRGQSSRLGALVRNTIHDNEECGPCRSTCASRA